MPLSFESVKDICLSVDNFEGVFFGSVKYEKYLLLNYLLIIMFI